MNVASPTNLSIAQSAVLRDIRDVATDSGLTSTEFEPLGYYKAKLTTEGVRRLREGETGKLVLVTAINPTPAGEGKTTVTIGLSQALRKLGRSAISATREPALGPIFGVKGGACGGGYSQVLPMEDINLFFNGDFPAISAAHNLLSAMFDAHIHNGNELGVDTRETRWPRTVDMNDRALRETLIGLGGRSNGFVRESGFVITPASEVMAIFCLSRSLRELKERLANIIVGVNRKREPIFARDLMAHGAMTALLRSALMPNLVQTIEGGLALVHGGPFGNIAHGCSSIISTECSLGLAEFTVTEAGFGSDLGGEKFMNIVAPILGRGPDTIVLVASLRSIRHHGGGDVELGVKNLERHIQHMRQYGPPVIVTVNRRADDPAEELAILCRLTASLGVEAIVSDPWNGGGEGCRELAEQVWDLSRTPPTFSPLYSPEQGLIEKLETLVAKVYKGQTVVLSETARKDLQWLVKNGFDRLPVCVAKSQYSFADDPSLGSTPDSFSLNVRSFRLSAGAGFIVAVCGDIMLMPGLGKTPAAFNIDVDDEGKIVGLF